MKKENELTERELKLQIELEKIRIKKIKLSSKCRIEELILKREIAQIYRNKKKIKKAEKEIENLKNEKRK